VIATLAEDGIAVQPHPDLAGALRVTEGARRVQGSRAYREGLVELQDLSPQLACAALPVRAGTRGLDYCAGGGGKALALAARGAQVTAWDADPARMRDLPVRAARAGVRIVRAGPAGPRGTFDLVVTDVPCSGSGTWRRTPNAKWRMSEAALTDLTARQDAILDAAARHVAPGGELAYMTCSVFTAENGDRIAAFLARRSGFRLVEMQNFTPLDAGDGFFLARLQALTAC
nr:RsmB/NOP family class I SAM-dependent RNA methyltransferase [Paracoccus sp. (in: a-proteobacteria)]